MKLDTARVFERIFAIYRDQAGVILPAALIVFVPVAVLAGLVVTGGGALLALLTVVIGFVATFWFQGVVVEAVRDIQDGRRDFSVGDLFRSVQPVLGTLMLAGVLAGLGIALGLVLLIVPGLFLLTYWAVIGPVIVIERTGAIDAFRRSQELVSGNAWRVFGVIVTLFVIQFVLNSLIGAIFGRDTYGGGVAASLVSNVLVAPIAAIAAAVMYLELRGMRGEPPVSAA